MEGIYLIQHGIVLMLRVVNLLLDFWAKYSCILIEDRQIKSWRDLV